MVLKRRNRTTLELVGNSFIHIAARSRLALQMPEPCKEQIFRFDGSITFPVFSRRQCHNQRFFAKGQGCSGVRRAFTGGQSAHPERPKLGGKFRFWGNLRESAGKWGEIEDMFSSCLPGSEKLATAMEVCQLVYRQRGDLKVLKVRICIELCWLRVFNDEAQCSPIRPHAKEFRCT